MAQDQRTLRPFEIGTDIRFESLGSQTFTQGGSDVSFTLNKTGLLAWLRMRVTGTMTANANSVYATYGPWNLIKRIRLVTNMQNIVPIDLSGYEMYLINCLMQRSWAPDRSADADLYTAPFNQAGASWVLMWDIPVSLNLGPQRRFGVINVQDPTVQVQLKLTPGANSDAITNPASSASLSVEVEQGNWEIPDQRVYEVPAGPGRQTIHYLLSKSYGLPAVGPNVLTLDRDDARLLRMIFYATVNGVRDSTNWTKFDLRYNVVNTPISRTEPMLKMDMRKETDLEWVDGAANTAAPRRGGVYFMDRWHSSHQQGAGSFWDTLYIPNISQIDFVPTLGSGGSPTTGDQLVLVRQELQRL